MLQVSPNLFRSAYNQVTSAERSFVDRIVARIVEEAERAGRPLTLLVDAPIPPALMAQDTRGWLQRPLVVAAITERVREVAEEADVTERNWIRRVHMLAHTNVSDYYEVDDLGLPVFDFDRLKQDGKASIIKSIEIDESDGLSRSTRRKIKFTFADPAVYLKMEQAYLGLGDGDSAHLKQQRAMHTPSLTDQSSVGDAADEYQRMIGDE